MICKPCAQAADYGKYELHQNCQACDCHHAPIAGKPRLEPMSPAESVGLARRCQFCDKVLTLTKTGAMRRHKPFKYAPYCAGSGVVFND